MRDIGELKIQLGLGCLENTYYIYHSSYGNIL